jgi:NAD(P)-dependent dehydrogenase (short-subunit alcohol dehydrogenase family)
VAFAEAMAEAGAHVAICDIDDEGLKETAERIRRIGAECLALHCDVSDEGEAARTVKEVVRHFGHLDVLINNAGIADPKLSGSPKMLHEYKTEWWDRVLAVDLQGVFYFTREALKEMVPRRRGKIINVASVWGLAGSSSIMPIPAYCTAKGALINLTRELALEYAPFGINVNVICPGFFVSRIGGCDDPSFVGTVMRFVPMGRFGYPEELKALAIFLASDGSNYMTGQAIAIDGGILAK